MVYKRLKQLEGYENDLNRLYGLFEYDIPKLKMKSDSEYRLYTIVEHAFESLIEEGFDVTYDKIGVYHEITISNSTLRKGVEPLEVWGTHSELVIAKFMALVKCMDGYVLMKEVVGHDYNPNRTIEDWE